MSFKLTRLFKDWINRTRAQLGQISYLYRLAPTTGCVFRMRRDAVVVRRAEKEIWVSRENPVYAQDVIQNFDYYFDVVEPRREDGRLVVDYSSTALHTMRESGISFWFPELAESMETTEIYLDRANLKPGQTVLDLGAYAGGAAYHFSRAVGDGGRVFAFEPDPKSFDCLIKNIALHRLHNVVPDRRGVWSETGRVLFQAEGNMGSAVVDASARRSETRTWIDVTTLADFCAEAGIDRVDFVKMDVEGSEAAILRTASEFIRKHRPPMIIEPHYVQGERTDPEVTRILESHGYSVESLDQAGLPLPLLFGRPG